MNKPYRNKKLLSAAKGQQYTLQIPGVCQGGTEKVSTEIEYLSQSDHLNRCRFFLNWKDGERNRGQVFFTDPHRYGHKRPEEMAR